MIAALSNGLQAAFLLVRGRADGLRFVDADARAVARSFWAIALCLPADLCVQLIGWATAASPERPVLPPHGAHTLVLQMLVFVIPWLGFAVLSHGAARLLGRETLWPRYIATWNWCSVAQVLLLVAAAVTTLADAPDWVSQTAELVVFGWSLWLEWFVARVALRVSAITAAGLVGLDVLIWFVVSAAAAPFLPG
jgi:hypothetical protein